MTIDDINENFKEQIFSVDFGKTLIRLLELSAINQSYLRSILQKQIETIELLKNNSEPNLTDTILDKLDEIENIVEQSAHENYYKILQSIVK